MKTETSLKIIGYIKSQGPASPGQLSSYLEISPQAVHAQLRKLLANQVLCRIGAPPNTVYDLEKAPATNM